MDLNSPIVDAYGRQVFTWGGTQAHGTYFFKGYEVTLEWFVGRRTTEPIMIIQDQKRGHNQGAVGICLSSIGNYADPDTPSNAAPGALHHCFGHLDCLGKAPIALEAKLLLDVILQFASRLILMPPTPRDVVKAAQPQSLLDVQITVEETGKTHSEVSI